MTIRIIMTIMIIINIMIIMTIITITIIMIIMAAMTVMKIMIKRTLFASLKRKKIRVICKKNVSTCKKSDSKALIGSISHGKIIFKQQQC